MSLLKSLTRIPSCQCARDAMQKLRTPQHFQIVAQSYPWCDKFCKDFCIKDATEDCMRESKAFCRMNCQKHCYYVGPTGSKKN